ncbi:DUF2231 domain-containing protein [Tautonia plasticadhaerens]|uniref:DUF2231 domain-containing protein n=1 Tax=Tautonia plasticadhaerens TaxID=2527974 RepID=A0A518H1E3_9BACT|nr:DUF2231 domain-containing protein [Tautonia plasticadhaerens]QDV34641.1 hypothetical protein ElP_25330 [Tautonia plasticadhaerens]
MESRAKFLGHPLHQMLIVFPLGLLVTSVVFDGIHYFGGRDPRWADISYWMIASGLIGGVVAAVPGWIDWFAIPGGTRAKAVGLWHGLGNALGVIGLFGLSWILRWDDPGAPSGLALLLSVGGLLVGGVTAWLGGELVDRLGVGVDPGAHLDAPNSLTHAAPGRGASRHA